MSTDPNAPRSRRALLTAAAGAAGAVAASAALPLTAAAAPTAMMTEQDNPSIDTTSVTQSAAGHVSFKATTTNTDAAGLQGSSGDESNMADDTSFTGIYGWTPASTSDTVFATGVWGDSEDVGVYGTGVVGVWGDGAVGVIGRGDPGGVGVRAIGDTATDIALRVDGKVLFSRAGKNTIGAGRSSLRINLAGTTANSRVFAVLHSNRSGRYVRAVVPTTGSFTIYLNTTVTSATFVAWFVIN